MRNLDNYINVTISAGKRFIGSSEGKAVLKAVGIGALYFTLHKLGVEFEPVRGLNITYDGRKRDNVIDFSIDEEDAPMILAIKEIKEEGINSWSDSSKLEYCKKIKDLVDNSELISSKIQRSAIEAIKEIKNSMWSSYNRSEATNYITEIVAM